MKLLVTGGAGFIGSNVADYFIKKGNKVVIVDNLSRKGTEKNLKWLKEKYSRLNFYKLDIRDKKKIFDLVKKEKPDAILHFAGQVAVTTSVEDPVKDKEINLDGTINLLEAVRKVSKNVPFLYASTNKVYGETSFPTAARKSRYIFKDKKLQKNGISESQQLDFHSPYGCSKGAADQYVRDYFRIYGIPTVVFRQSCIYGPRQFGNEDQGWVMHFIRLALEKKPITIFGDGKQVRDILEISDLIRLYEISLQKIIKIKGEVYNIGGGPKLSISLLELISLLEQKLDYKIKLRFSSWRPGDQKIYVSDIAKAKKLGWIPKVGIEKGLDRLIEWGRAVIKS